MSGAWQEVVWMEAGGEGRRPLGHLASSVPLT